MDIQKKQDGTTLMVALSGRLDTVTSPQLGEELENGLDGIENLVLDFTDLGYISSAGLRVLLQAQKTMNKKGTMVVRGVNPDVMEVFQITGFGDILTVEPS